MESTDMHIPLETFQRAISILDEEEKTMHLALTVDSANPLSKVCNNVYNFIVKNKGANLADLICEFWDNLPQGNKSMDEVTTHLIAMDKIKTNKTETGEVRYIDYDTE